MRTPHGCSETSGDRAPEARDTSRARAHFFFMTTPHLGVELSRLGYPRYANELRELHQTLNAFCNPQVPGAEVPRCMSCTLEIELSYLRLRTTRPRVVWEISPLHGFTTMMILTALHLNNNSARLHSFDRHGGALVHVIRRPTMKHVTTSMPTPARHQRRRQRGAWTD